MSTYSQSRDDTSRGQSSRTALSAGIIAGPLMVAVSFAQIPFRDGFDLTRHAFSFLLIGPGGWLQLLNYLVAGVLYIIAGFGLSRTLGGLTGRAAQILATCLGAGLILAGIFPPPPSFGYPAGAPEGVPEQVTATAVLHGVGFALGALSLAVLLLVLASWLRHRSPGLAVLALITGLAQLSVPPASGLRYGTVWLYVAVTAAFITTSIVLARIRTLD